MPHNQAQKPRAISCGCCTGGCVCHIHQDMTRGIPARVCDHHREPAHAPGPYTVHRVPNPRDSRIIGFELRAETKHGTAIVAEMHAQPRLAIVCERTANLLGAAPQLLAALRNVEWGGQDDDPQGGYVFCCPECEAPRSGGKHHKGCTLAAALAKAEPRQ